MRRSRSVLIIVMALALSLLAACNQGPAARADACTICQVPNAYSVAAKAINTAAGTEDALLVSFTDTTIKITTADRKTYEWDGNKVDQANTPDNLDPAASVFPMTSVRIPDLRLVYGEIKTATNGFRNVSLLVKPGWSQPMIVTEGKVFDVAGVKFNGKDFSDRYQLAGVVGDIFTAAGSSPVRKLTLDFTKNRWSALIGTGKTGFLYTGGDQPTFSIANQPMPAWQEALHKSDIDPVSILEMRDEGLKMSPTPQKIIFESDYNGRWRAIVMVEAGGNQLKLTCNIDGSNCARS